LYSRFAKTVFGGWLFGSLSDPRYRSSVQRSCTDQGTSSRGHAANGFRTIKNRKQSLVTDAMVLLSKTFLASWSIGLAAALVAAIPPGMARAENIVGGAFAPCGCRKLSPQVQKCLGEGCLLRTMAATVLDADAKARAGDQKVNGSARSGNDLLGS
jgi:hypothetical protein